MDAATWSAWQTAVDYQFYHGLGIIAVGILANRYAAARWIAASGWVLLAGAAAFCGSIYATTFGAPEAIGSVAPLGGLAMMAGWFMLAFGALRARRTRPRS